MNLGPSRRLFAAVLAVALPACSESASPGASGAAPTAAAERPTATAATSATAESSAAASASASAAPTASATAEPAVTASATTSATAAAKPTATSKPAAKPAASASSSVAAKDPATTPAASGTASAAAATSVEIAPPAPDSADAIAQKIDAIFAPKKNFAAKFKQRLEQKVSGTKKESSGTLNVERPSKISFRYDPPNQNRIVADGSTLKAYIAEDSQMITAKVDSSAYAGGLAFLMGGLLKTMSFTFNTKADYKDGYVLTGKPRSSSPNYEFVMFYVNKALLEKGDPGCIERIVIVDAQGNKNRFDFTGASFPTSVAASEWDFTPPPGTTIVKN